VLLAELEVWHSRPYAPTRRVALGHLVLPVDPAPGFGGLLLGAVIAAHLHDVDGDLLPDVHRLLDQIGRGERVIQPRLQHRFQTDRHGLAVSAHRMVGDGDHVSFDLQSAGRPLAQVLGAIYAVERLDLASRTALVPVLHRAMRWRGPVGPAFVTNLAGASGATLHSLADPRAWALELLGFPMGTTKPNKREVMSQFRLRLREVHPDHGGDHRDAAKEIDKLGQARAILLEAAAER
jgi:hypothetical protein